MINVPIPTISERPRPDRADHEITLDADTLRLIQPVLTAYINDALDAGPSNEIMTTMRDWHRIARIVGYPEQVGV